ncbi:MAG: hypothetical protein HC837_02760 [Chloroflexaceae bacterium]|nr:hypothetical protein [Chloroflexaceae bacterium]
MSEYDVRWETVEHGWRAVVMDTVGSSPQFTAFVKYVGAPYWRIWAGCLFNTLEEAQQWCRAEIIKNAHSQRETQPWHAEPPAWRWLWDTLYTELGEKRTFEIRDELARRINDQDQR